MELCVITSVPNPESSGGNLAVALIYHTDGGVHPLAGQVAISGGCTEVFRVGEIIVLDSEYGREIGGAGREPSKWDVQYDTFGTDLEAAVARSRQVCE